MDHGLRVDMIKGPRSPQKSHDSGEITVSKIINPDGTFLTNHI